MHLCLDVIETEIVMCCLISWNSYVIQRR